MSWLSEILLIPLMFIMLTQQVLKNVSFFVFFLTTEFKSRYVKWFTAEESFKFHYNTEEIGLSRCIFVDDILLFSKKEAHLVFTLLRGVFSISAELQISVQFIFILLPHILFLTIVTNPFTISITIT